MHFKIFEEYLYKVIISKIYFDVFGQTVNFLSRDFISMSTFPSCRRCDNIVLVIFVERTNTLKIYTVKKCFTLLYS